MGSMPGNLVPAGSQGDPKRRGRLKRKSARQPPSELEADRRVENLAFERVPGLELFVVFHDDVSGFVAGVTEDEFAKITRDWFAAAKHPKLGRLFTQCIWYALQVELLEFLRVSGFKTFIVSGGGIDLMRAFAEEAYGIPPEQVIGSSVKTEFDVEGDTIGLMKLSELNKLRRPRGQNIGLHI